MSKLAAGKVSDYPFAEIAKVVQRIEVSAYLKEVSDTAVTSFYFGTSTIGDLIRRKYTTLSLLTSNRSKLKVFISEWDKRPEPVEVAVVVSMLRTINEQVSIVKEQIERAIKLTQYEAVPMHIELGAKELSNDEIPF